MEYKFPENPFHFERINIEDLAQSSGMIGLIAKGREIWINSMRAYDSKVDEYQRIIASESVSIITLTQSKKSLYQPWHNRKLLHTYKFPHNQLGFEFLSVGTDTIYLDHISGGFLEIYSIVLVRLPRS